MPSVKEPPAGVETIPIPLPSPEAMFRRLTRRRGVAWLDSADTHPQWGRFSVLAAEPVQTLSTSERPLTALQQRLDQTTEGGSLGRAENDSPIPCFCGWIGYIAYDVGRDIETLPARAIDDLAWPVIQMGLYDSVAVYDHQSGKSYIQLVKYPGGSSVETRLAFWRAIATEKPAPSDKMAPPEMIPPPESNIERTDYLTRVARAVEYIRAGDIFQVNLSQRFHSRLPFPAPELYCRLRRTNPASFAAYLKFGRRAVLSSSPELFLLTHGDRVVTRPIKGTRGRGRNPEEDEALKRELLASEKDAAELTMIIDLERNDLGRVCQYGSVRVTAARELETHPTVHHLVGTVEGRLRRNCSLIDLLRATLPGGSITGAPKVRAMEIIEELEPVRRSVYTGSIGVLGWDGSCRLNLAIRTMLADGEDVFWQVGGGIVADSIPQAEYQETLDKGRGLLAALQATKLCS